MRSIKLNESVNFIPIDYISLFSFFPEILYFFRAKIGRVYAGRFLGEFVDDLFVNTKCGKLLLLLLLTEELCHEAFAS